VISETQGRADFWERARSLGVRVERDTVHPWVLIDTGRDDAGTYRLAATLSRELGTMAIGFVVQTTADVHEAQTFAKGVCIRKLVYLREQGWLAEGVSQPWERPYFFGDPDAGGDELTDEEQARLEAAKTAGDPSLVLDLLHVSSTAEMHRVCEALGAPSAEPSGRWQKPSVWSRLFGG
jgi:hypothetical protein